MMYPLAVFTEINAHSCLFFSPVWENLPLRLLNKCLIMFRSTQFCFLTVLLFHLIILFVLSLVLFFFLPCAHLSCFLFFSPHSVLFFIFFFLCSLSHPFPFCIPILTQKKLALGHGIQSQRSKATSHDRRKEDTLWPLSEMKLTSQASLPLSSCPFPPLNIDEITLAAC